MEQSGGTVGDDVPAGALSPAESDLVAEIRRRREAAGLSQARLAALTGYSLEHVSRAERIGRGLASANVVHAIDHALQANGVLNALRVRADAERRARRSPSAGARTSTGSHRAPALRTTFMRDMADDEGVNRRQFLGVVGATVSGSAALGAIGTGRMGVMRVGATDVAMFRRSAQMLAAQTQMIGGGSLCATAINAYRQVKRLVDEADYGESVGRALLVVAGEFAVGAGWTSYDVGDQRLARHLFVEAVLLAGQAGSNALTLRALNALTLQAAHLANGPLDGRCPKGPPREAVRFADRMADLCRTERSFRLQALAAGHQTVARALVGDEDGFRQAVQRAWRATDRLDDSETDPDWLNFVSPEAVATYVARGHRYRREPETAVEILRTFVSDDGASPWNRANHRAQLAVTLAEAGDADAAVAVGRSVLRVLDNAAISSPRTVTLLEPVNRIANCTIDENTSNKP
jgi:transcriptional regulator with XRE-family HTH domain